MPAAGPSCPQPSCTPRARGSVPRSRLPATAAARACQQLPAHPCAVPAGAPVPVPGSAPALSVVCLFVRGLCVPVSGSGKSGWFFGTTVSSAASISQSGPRHVGGGTLSGAAGAEGSSSLPLRLPRRSTYSSEELRLRPAESGGLSGHTERPSRLLQGQDQDPQPAGGLAWREGHRKAGARCSRLLRWPPRILPGDMCNSFPRTAPASSAVACGPCPCFHGRAVFSGGCRTASNKRRSHSGRVLAASECRCISCSLQPEVGSLLFSHAVQTRLVGLRPNVCACRGRVP